MKRLLSAIILTLIISIRLEAQTSITINPTDPNVGVILGDVVNVRQQPSAASPLVDTVKENDYVKIIQWTTKQETIGKFTDKWVKVQTKNGKEGFLFGAFVFDLDSLYKQKWRGKFDCYDGSEIFIFLRNKKIKYELLVPGLIDKRNGAFHISGRKIVISIPNTEQSDGKKIILFFMKYKRKNLLYDKLIKIDFDNFSYFTETFRKAGEMMGAYQQF